MKRMLLAYLAGVASVLGVAFHAGPEAVVVAGLKFAAASSDYDWQAVPREKTPVSYATRDLIVEEDLPATKPAPKGKRR